MRRVLGCGSRVAREFVYFLVVVSSSNCQARWRGCSGVWMLLGAFHVWQLEAALEFLWGKSWRSARPGRARVLGTYSARGSLARRARGFLDAEYLICHNRTSRT